MQDVCPKGGNVCPQGGHGSGKYREHCHRHVGLPLDIQQQKKDSPGLKIIGCRKRNKIHQKNDRNLK